MSSTASCTAFEGTRRIAGGAPRQVAAAVRQWLDSTGADAAHADSRSPLLIFDDSSGRQVEFDLRGTVAEVEARFDAQSAASGRAARADEAPPSAGTARSARSAQSDTPQADTSPASTTPRGRGRPKLGVIAREVTLLPRHWEWLNGQPGGASVALRRLVEAARAANGNKDRVRAAQEAAWRFMTALAGDLAGYEEATRALYASDAARFNALLAGWPADVRDYAATLAAPAFE